MNGERARILVVDDEESIRSFLQRVLQEAGYDVVTAANGQEALNKITESGASVVCLDVKMPGISGMEVLRQIMANWPQTCVIMATAVADAQTAVDAMKLGAYDYITKPFNRDNVLLTIKRAIEKRNLLLENERHRSELEKRVGEQTERLQQQFVELVETLAREQRLIYRLAYSQRGGKELLSRLPKELQEPLSSVEEYSEALIRILRRGIVKPSRASRDSSKGSRG
ncbi:MAG: sigma-54-dependent Fis family transcriptional regulator [Chloroflexi bacterium]|nr:sigma-54-dependent Fis family transcriptional regulator [Chloroflexota bacterium]